MNRIYQEHFTRVFDAKQNQYMNHSLIPSTNTRKSSWINAHRRHNVGVIENAHRFNKMNTYTPAFVEYGRYWPNIVSKHNNHGDSNESSSDFRPLKLGIIRLKKTDWEQKEKQCANIWKCPSYPKIVHRPITKIAKRKMPVGHDMLAQ